VATTVAALSELGTVDLFALTRRQRTEAPVVPPAVRVDRLYTVPYPLPPPRVRLRLTWLLSRGTPLRVVRGRLSAGPLVEFEQWAADRYDAVWCSTAALYDWLQRPRRGPTVVDFVDLEDEKAGQRIALARARRPRGARARLRQELALAQERRTQQGWRRFQRSVAAGVDRVVVCSELDRQRTGLANAVVVPNTYERTGPTAGRAAGQVPPTLLFHGSLEYLPNVDAATWLAAAIGPAVRRRLPGTMIRLAGAPSAEVAQLHDPPDVTVVGRVADMATELAGADVAVIPIRFGSGTRIKIIEAFAHRVPVVSTTIGAEGLDALAGVHLLLAEEPEAFAAACQRLATEPDLRRRLVDSAEQLFLDRFQGSVARREIAQVVRQVGAAPPG
jgi:glycosyltransferase involved in cell wall biosynthesis